MKYVFMDLPLESIHKLAFKAAEVARCAGEQGKYWEMHDRLFANQNSLEPWVAHADALGLARAQFDDCLSSGRHAHGIRRHMAEARKAGVTGTPTFFLAYTEASTMELQTVKRLAGAQSFANLKAHIERLLAQDTPELVPPVKK